MGISAVIYGYVMTAVVGYTVDMIMAGSQQSSQVFIVTHDYEKMAQAIVDNVHRGVTLIDSQGWYSKKESKIVMVVWPQARDLDDPQIRQNHRPRSLHDRRLGHGRLR